MKKLFLFAILALGSLTMFAQSTELQVKTTSSGKLINMGKMATVTTTDSTLTTRETITILNNSAGILIVTVVAHDSLGNGVTFRGTYRYSKAAGTLTLSSVTNQSALTTDTGLGTATATFTAASNNCVLKLKGKLGYTVHWRYRIEQIYP